MEISTEYLLVIIRSTFNNKIKSFDEILFHNVLELSSMTIEEAETFSNILKCSFGESFYQLYSFFLETDFCSRYRSTKGKISRRMMKILQATATDEEIGVYVVRVFKEKRKSEDFVNSIKDLKLERDNYRKKFKKIKKARRN